LTQPERGVTSLVATSADWEREADSPEVCRLGVTCDNKEYNKRSVYGIDSGKLIMNTKKSQAC
jgi:hypothetical protein